MKKTIIFLISLLYFLYYGINFTYASVSRTVNSGARNCPSGSVPSSNTSSAPTSGSRTCTDRSYIYNSTYNVIVNKGAGVTSSCGNNMRVLSQTSSQMTCQSRDNTQPTVSANNSSSTVRRNTNTTITLSTGDTGLNGGSGSSWIQARYSWSNDLNTACTSGGTAFTNATSIINSTEGIRTLYLCARDAALNVITWSGVYMLDKTPPVPSDISGNGVTKNGTYIMANTSENFNISVSNGTGSPITSVQGRFERYNSPATTSNINSVGDFVSSTNGNLALNRDVRLVDNQRTINNYREYLFRVTQICDAALNCMTAGNLPTYTYNIYANYINGANSTIPSTSEFTSSQIANGVTKTLNFILKDSYNNNIVPVYRSNGTTILRRLDFSLNYNNDLYLNQYNRTGASGVDISGFDNSTFTVGTIGNTIPKATNITDKNNNDGNYSLGFNVYSPTYNSSATNGQQYVDGSFNINNIVVRLTDNPTSNNLLGTVNFQFRPPYNTEIKGSIIDNGLIVGSTQEGDIEVTSSGTKNILLEYGYFDSGHQSHSNLSMRYKKSALNSWSNIVSGKQVNQTSLTNFGTITSPIITQLVQDGTLSTAEQNTYFATHIRYTISGKTIIYSSDIYGMNRYAGTPIGDNTSQRGVKIEGLTHSQKQVELVSGQEGTDYAILGNLEKSILQRDIRKNAYSLVREITPSNGARNITNLNQTSPGVKLGDVLYFGNLGGANVTLNLSANYSGKKTILIEGGNLYIRSQLLANNKLSDILGIIVLKDENGNGGHIFIDKDILEVDAILYADKAIASSDTFIISNSNDLNKILSPENGGTYDYLNKQLYIFGSVFSNNTIGGSVGSPYMCPYFITSSCTLDISQKYDMNYLRRGYEFKNNASYQDYPVIIKYNSLIQLDPPPLFNR